MTFLGIVRRSLWHHLASTLLAVFSIALGLALLVAVTSLREQTHRHFVREGLGVDAVLGPKGSPLQVVLNAMYHLEDTPGKIRWRFYQEVLRQPVVEEGIPFVTGHSYAGFRVNAIDGRFFSHFEVAPGRGLSFRAEEGGHGRAFEAADEAVAGSEVARSLHLSLGQVFSPVCGTSIGDPVHRSDRFRFVGILAPTGTPHDRAIYIPLKSFYALGGHSAQVAAMAVRDEQREISGAFLRIRRIRGGALHPGLQDLKYQVDQSHDAQIVLPSEVLPRLFSIVGWADVVLLAISLLVTLMALLFLLVALASSLRERRRDLALLRCLGATRRIVFGLMLCEAALIAALGAVVGVVLGHAVVAVGCHYINLETGLAFSALSLSWADLVVVPSAVALGLAAGLLPAWRAYRLGILDNLVPIS